MMQGSSLPAEIERLLFARRKIVIGIFLIITSFMLWSASHLEVDAGFSKLLPLEHEYMQTFAQHQDEFGGANRILIALTVREGDIFTPEFFAALRAATDEVFFIPWVDRAQIKSLFTPNVRFTEVVEDGITGGNVIPDDFETTEAGLNRVRENIIKAGILGRLVANDFSGALISAQLLQLDPKTGEKIDYTHVAEQLEKNIREKYSDGNSGAEIDYHIIGFAKLIGDITNGAKQIIGFFIIAFLITALLVMYYSRSTTMAIAALACSLIAVIWQLGVLSLCGFGIDPMSMLLPFLIFAIGVSHSVQMIGAIGAEMRPGVENLEVCRKSFRKLFIPGSIALISDAVGFISILLIEIDIIQEMAVTASIGVAMIIFTNLFLFPVLISFIKFDASCNEKLKTRGRALRTLWQKMAGLTCYPYAQLIILFSLLLGALAFTKATEVKIGDLHSGVAELHRDSRYNIDTDAITKRFSIGVDVISIIAETKSDGCIDYEIMDLIDRLEWHMKNTPGVQSAISLPSVAKRINAGWNEGNMKWRVLPRNQSALTRAVSHVPTSSGLLNSDCGVMPVHVYTKDHKAETIDTVIDSINDFKTANQSDLVNFRLATGNVGIMAATNQVVSAAQFPILLYVFSAIILLCLLLFRSIIGVLCIVLPLVLASLLAYALMNYLEIGLKVNTLPVVALGVGIGVDYGIYIYSRLSEYLQKNMTLQEAFFNTLQTSGFGVIFTGITLATGVITWLYSPLKFQADMGILLTFMFLINMLGAILILPAIASVLMNKPGLRKKKA